ncbi:MAG TPA: hypothetical protein PKE29_18010, partial [Phycisphaerales bacterium]|nr:hypothetical protein [Phycisphaerales bacterium]
MSTPNSTTVEPAPTSDPARQAWRDRLANPEPIPAHEFEPPPPIAEQILSDAANHTIHLADIAAKAHTSIETLCLWLARPDIAARSDAIEAVVRRRARLAALNTIPEIIEVCATIMERYRRAPDRGPEDYKDPRTHAVQIRNAANALMAARI